ncbi:DUF2971 domain-containing protein [Plesiomonas shigelloides]|uniref:DUF2971 domain-containing protein n=1 Tax=Plesiomonas shigelloides TaxID=703 RepID=UPI001483BA5C|nr:DUF2971 domain-containing protein [Plesiomonas shigelloides]
MDLIYHYTSAAGLRGICGQDNVMLRATDSRYLNDIMEISRGVDKARQQIEYYLSGEQIRRDIPNAKEFSLKLLKEVDESIFYTISFCKDGDKLAQWLSYCPQVGGYSIGFDRGKVEEEIDKSPFDLADVSYTDKLYEFVSSAKRIENDIDPIEDRIQRDSAMYEIFPSVIQEIALFKDEKFHTEDEVRLFYCRRREHKPCCTIDFFEKSSLLIPYMPCKLDKDTVKKIIIGPMQHQELAFKSLLDFKETFGYKFSIERSSIPLRSF